MVKAVYDMSPIYPLTKIYLKDQLKSVSMRAMSTQAGIFDAQWRSTIG